MIRVTNAQLFRTALNSVFGARARLQEHQETAMSGLRVEKPSDDPTAYARARLVSSLETAAESHIRNAESGRSRLQTAEAALAGVHDQLQRAKELALGAANGTQSAEQRQAVASEVSQIRSTVIDLMNTQHLGEYVFAHVDTLTPPYDATAGAFSYDYDTYDNVREVGVGPSTTAEIGASGSAAFAPRASVAGAVDVPAVLANLEANLNANDPDAVRLDIDSISTAFDQVLAERTRVGVRMQRIQSAADAASQSQTVYSMLRGDLVDADAAEAFSNLTLAETTMQAAVTVASRILGPSLLNT